MRRLIRFAAAVALTSWIFGLASCATTDQGSQTDKTREHADEGMKKLQEEEGNHGY